MDKLKLETHNLTDKNVEKIGKLFPNVITEGEDEDGNFKKVIDFEKLKQELSESAIDGEESYDFTWVGKNESIVEANKPIRKTLRPDRESSVDWENTQNIYIEGDNLEALKLLQESYLGRIKMIYIDPPYNTGNDFVYRDNFTQDKDSYNESLGVTDDEGNKLFQNTESNGRFHSDWCSMIYPRLKLARNLLSDDGVIFISIDDHEVVNIKNICNEVFGEENFVGDVIIKSNPRGSQSVEYIAYQHEYLLIYAKNYINAGIVGHALSDNMLEEYKYEDKNGKYRLLGLRQRGGFWRRTERPLLYYPIYVDTDNGNVSLNKDNRYTYEVFPYQPSTGEDGTWRWGKDKFTNEKSLLLAKPISRNGHSDWDIFQKDYLNTKGNNPKRTKVKSLWDEREMNYQNGSTEIRDLFNNSGIFTFSKPKAILIKCIEMLSFKPSDIVLDFFSGSATTAHAVMQLNAEDNGNRKYIMVQLPEKTSEKSEAYKAGFKNICQIGEERIRRAGQKIKEEIEQENQQLKIGEEPKKVPDIGFRVFKVDDTNMNDVYYAPKDYNKTMLEKLTSNIKSDRTDEDLLYGVLLDWGVELSLPHKIEMIDGKRVHIVNGEDQNADLIACFEENISEYVVREIAKKQPTRVVFRDSSFTTDDHKINVEEIFKLLAPNTTVKVI